MSLEPSLSINWVDLVQGAFTAKVARTRLTYTITPRMFVSGIVQYNNAGTSFGSNVRFRWEYRPGSELFVVYMDDYNTNELRPEFPYSATAPSSSNSIDYSGCEPRFRHLRSSTADHRRRPAAG